MKREQSTAARDQSSRGILWPMVLAVPIIAALAVAIITTLRHRAADSREIAGTLASLDRQATALNTMTWQAVARRHVGKEVRTALDQTRAHLGETLAYLEVLGSNPDRRQAIQLA